MGPKPGPEGRLAITMPMGDAKLPGIAAEDIGKCALGIFKRGDELQTFEEWANRNADRIPID